MKILIAHPQIDFRDLLKLHLQETLSDRNVSIEDVGHFTAAREKLLGASYDYFITSLDLPASHETTTDDLRRGLQLAKNLSDPAPRTTNSLILVPASLPADVQPLEPGGFCSFITELPETLLESISSRIRSVVSGVTNPVRLSLMIAQDPNSPNWNFWLDGGSACGLPERGSFMLPGGFIDSLAERSKRLEGNSNWLTDLTHIGRELCAMIFKRQDAFTDIFDSAVKKVGGIDRIRFSFDISRKHYSLAIEALIESSIESSRSASNELPFWMLQSPIYRSLSLPDPLHALGEQPRPRLFQDAAQPINCLIIQADARGRPGVPGADFPSFLQLPNILKECDDIESLLNRHKKSWHIGELKRLTQKDRDRGRYHSFAEYARATLAEKNWHIVHFCGHSYYQQPEISDGLGAGWLIFPGRRPDAIPVDEFAYWLKAAQFVFLSSCESSKEAFAFELAKNKIPAVLGFRWRVDDFDVPNFAKSFYQNLFRHKSIDFAFLEARKVTKKRCGVNNQIWAAPMLVMQQPMAASAGAAT
jgi:hypothetical protein